MKYVIAVGLLGSPDQYNFQTDLLTLVPSTTDTSGYVLQRSDGMNLSRVPSTPRTWNWSNGQGQYEVCGVVGLVACFKAGGVAENFALAYVNEMS